MKELESVELEKLNPFIRERNREFAREERNAFGCSESDIQELTLTEPERLELQARVKHSEFDLDRAVEDINDNYFIVGNRDNIKSWDALIAQRIMPRNVAIETLKSKISRHRNQSH